MANDGRSKISSYPLVVIFNFGFNRGCSFEISSFSGWMRETNDGGNQKSGGENNYLWVPFFNRYIKKGNKKGEKG
jgi:hypothetical protein